MMLAAANMLALVFLAGCSPVSAHGADKYFEGRALQLAIASESSDAETATRLIRDDGVDPDTAFSHEDGVPLVAWPIRARNLDGLRALLKNGANPNARTYKDVDGRRIGYNNAMVYAAKLDDPRFLELLLEHGGDPNTRTSNNETLMHQAFLSGNQWKNVQLLVTNGANINAPNHAADDTILSSYTSRGGFDSAYWLLEHGADPTLELAPLPGSGQKARQLMVEDIYWEITTPDLIPWQKKCQQWLIERGIPRPAMPGNILKKRAAFGYPTEEKDIPLL